MTENKEVQAWATDPDPEVRIQNLQDLVFRHEHRIVELERQVEELQAGYAYREPMDLRGEPGGLSHVS